MPAAIFFFDIKFECTIMWYVLILHMNIWTVYHFQFDTDVNKMKSIKVDVYLLSYHFINICFVEIWSGNETLMGIFQRLFFIWFKEKTSQALLMRNESKRIIEKNIYKKIQLIIMWFIWDNMNRWSYDTIRIVIDKQSTRTKTRIHCFYYQYHPTDRCSMWYLI